MGAYGLLAALFQLAVSGAGPGDMGGQRCAHFAGDIRTPPGMALCAAWSRPCRARPQGSSDPPALDDVWVEAVAAGAAVESMWVEVLKRREFGPGRDSLLYTTAHGQVLS